MSTNPYFDANDRAAVDIEVSNPLNWKRPVTAVIDSGFDGFLSLPILQAFPIGLLLLGTMTLTLADGSMHQKLCCLGNVEFGGEKQSGTIIIDGTSTIALVGIDFIRTFRRRLVIDPINRTVLLN